MFTQRFLVVAAAICLATFSAKASAGALEDVTSHTAAGKTVFLVLTDSSSRNLAEARAVAAGAKQRTANSEVVVLNRSDPAQRAAVDRFRVAAAPVPLVLCVASNGYAVGAVRPLAKGAVQRLAGMVPSPAKAEYLRVLSLKRVAAVVFSGAAMTERSPLFEQITKATRNADLKMSTILVDVADTREAKWIKEWKIAPESLKRPLMVFVNPKGQVIGTLSGAPTAAQITEMALKKVRGCQDPQCSDPNCRHGR